MLVCSALHTDCCYNRPVHNIALGLFRARIVSRYNWYLRRTVRLDVSSEFTDNSAGSTKKRTNTLFPHSCFFELMMIIKPMNVRKREHTARSNNTISRRLYSRAKRYDITNRFEDLWYDR